MRQIPQALRDAISGRVIRPTAYLDVWADKALLAEITTSSDWQQAIAATNVDTQRVPGSVVLAPGATHPVAAASSWAQVLQYRYIGTQPGVRIYKDSGVQRLWWTARANQLIRDLRMRISAAIIDHGSVPIEWYGPIAWIGVQVWIEDANGNQIGNQVSYDLYRYTTGYTPITLVSGVNAGVIRNRQYAVCIRTVNLGEVYANYAEVQTTIGAAPDTDEPAAQWRIPTQVAGRSILAGGDEAYQPSGSITVQVDLGQTPPNTGTIYMVDQRPAGTGITYQAQWSDDGVTWSGWAPVASGDTLSAHRYWQIRADLTSNATNDETPQVDSIRLEYWVQGSKHTLATVPQVQGGKITAARALENISALSQQLSPKVPATIEGEMQVTLAPTQEVQAMMRTLTRGRRARIRIGADGVPDTLPIYDGAVYDVRYSARSGYQLTLRDLYQIAGDEVPSQRYPDWSSTASYQIGDRVSYAGRGYQALKANIGVQPDTDPTTWQDIGGVWSPADYSPATNGGVRWHLCDIILDILRNHTSVRDDQIDLASIQAVKALHPNRTGNRVITKPTKALDLLAELAWLLEAQWTVRQGKLALIPEPDPASVSPVAQLTDDVIEDGLQIRYGWGDAVNTGILLTGYTGEGTGADKYTSGRVYVDAAALSDHGMPIIRRFEDRWNLDDTAGVSDVLARIQAYVQRWRYGRAVIRCRAALRLMHLEPGDVVTIVSDQLPPDRRVMTAMVIRSDLDWLHLRLSLTLLEV